MYTLTGQSKNRSVRQRVEGKILRFSLVIGVISAAFAICLYAAVLYPAVWKWQRINQLALSEISCSDSQCDTSEFASSWNTEPDYVIDLRDRYVISAQPLSSEDPQRYGPLDFADIEFIRKFREPASYHTPDNEVWRLFSSEALLNGKKVELLVGYAEKSPTNAIDMPQSVLPDLDSKLKRVASMIAESLDQSADVGNPAKLLVDGFEVVDVATLGSVFSPGLQNAAEGRNFALLRSF